MQKEKLINKAKLCLRLSSGTNIFNDEIESLIDFVISDFKRIGVAQKHINDMDGVMLQAVLTYVKANFGNSNQFEQLNASYDQLIIKIRGSYKYFE